MYDYDNTNVSALSNFTSSFVTLCRIYLVPIVLHALGVDWSRVNYPVLWNWHWGKNRRHIDDKVYALKHVESGFLICSLGIFKSFLKSRYKTKVSS